MTFICDDNTALKLTTETCERWSDSCAEPSKHMSFEVKLKMTVIIVDKVQLEKLQYWMKKRCYTASQAFIVE